MFPWRIFGRVVFIQAAIGLLTLFGAGLSARLYFESQFIAQSQNQLRDTLSAISSHIARDQLHRACQSSMQTELRLTIILQDGTVRCDSQHDPAKMENHATRPEFQDALHSGYGFSMRESETLQSRMIYGAMAHPSGQWVIRGAFPLTQLTLALERFDTSFRIFLVAALALIVLFATWAARNIVLPIRGVSDRLNAILQGRVSPARNRELLSNSYGEWPAIESALDQVSQNVESREEFFSKERSLHDTVLSAINEGILAVDVKGEPVFVNSSFLEIFGIEDFRRPRTLWETLRIPELLDPFRAAIQAGKSSSLIPIHLEQTRRFISVSVSPLKAADRATYGAVGIFHDLTEIKKAEQIRTDFIANASHELKTPLTAIKGFSETLLDDLKAGNRPELEYAEAIHRNSERMMALVRDLLDLSALETGSFLTKADLDTEIITSRALASIRTGVEAKHQEIRTRFEIRNVQADAHRIEQVLVNLLDNANKYCPDGATIEVLWTTGPHNSPILTVRDNGPGIAKEHLPRLFERFYRVNGARSRELGGTGLGLAIVKHIMLRHGGNVRVESEAHKGTTFVCEFP